MSETCIKLGEHGARVMIEDKEIPHYAMHVNPAKKEVSCWIPSEEGKAFSVGWLDVDVDYPSAGELYLDGHSVGWIVRRSAKSIVIRRGIVSESSIAPFLFSPLVVTDDDTYLDTSHSHSIGEIKLVIFRTTIPEREKRKEKHTINNAPPQLQKVHERSKKAMAHRVSYGSEVPRESWTHSAKLVERLVTFIFKYRPLEMLRANEIVPRNPEPHEPQEFALDTSHTSKTSSGKGKRSKVEKDGSETDDEDSIREKALLAEVQRCQVEAEKYQAEVERIRKGRHLKDSELERPKKRSKKEEKPVFIPGEIIDLTL